MEYDNRVLIIMGLCVAIGTIMLLIGIISSEVEIVRNQHKEIYDNINN